MIELTGHRAARRVETAGTRTACDSRRRKATNRPAVGTSHAEKRHHTADPMPVTVSEGSVVDDAQRCSRDEVALFCRGGVYPRPHSRDEDEYEEEDHAASAGTSNSMLSAVSGWRRSLPAGVTPWTSRTEKPCASACV